MLLKILNCGRRTLLSLKMLNLVFSAEIGKKWERLMESKKYKNLVEWYNILSRQYDLDEMRTTYLATYSLKED